MNSSKGGWILFLASLGMMCGLIGSDISDLTSFSEVWTPGFIGGSMLHFATVVTAFIGGKLIPTNSENNK